MLSTRSLRSLLPLALLCLLLAGAAVQADDFNPPWWRGQPGSTFQMWTFDGDNPAKALPDQWYNPYGAAFISSGYAWTYGTNYIEDSALDIFVANRPSDDPFKLIRLQVTLVLDQGQEPGLLVDFVTTPNSQWEMIDSGMAAPNQGWADFLLWPNPYEETIKLASHDGSTLKWDQIVIDTWCTSAPTPPVPEPMSMTLTALGLAGVIGSRRRKR